MYNDSNLCHRSLRTYTETKGKRTSIKDALEYRSSCLFAATSHHHIPGTSAIILSPSFHLEADDPSLSTTPDASRPRISDSPGGGGYRPFL